MSTTTVQRPQISIKPFLYALLSLILFTLCIAAAQFSSSREVSSLNLLTDKVTSTPVLDTATVLSRDKVALSEYLSTGGDPDIKDNSGDSLLHLAVKEGKIDLVELLAAYGADINIGEARDGFTPLMYAVIQGDSAMVAYLIRLGADPAVSDNEGYSAYHYAAARQPDLLRLISAYIPMPVNLLTNDGLSVADIRRLGEVQS